MIGNGSLSKRVCRSCQSDLHISVAIPFAFSMIGQQ
ncbi:hypothetical protein CECT5772_03794 [Streptococcus equi subsp. ruminatorum CECT 5772]|uniref:Uncharacterized protein n=1 Tax=Streptococcus equi subsp. ruminatorum CECT 5772 TaxID=1051981 RepID=A0A922NUU6_9STRE|nr:hypothetical protein CECT5772_03794 [Streptococcus equi subsp. ruminatorum CECT 5772]